MLWLIRLQKRGSESVEFCGSFTSTEQKVLTEYTKQHGEKTTDCGVSLYVN